MKVRFHASSPEGDLPLGPRDLDVPFQTRPNEPHPFLTLGDYLRGLRAFLLQEEGRPLCRALGDRFGCRLTPLDLREISIRTEKHGALYHVASVDLFTGSERVRLAASTAVSSRARRCLDGEERLMAELEQTFSLPYLPKPLLSGHISCGDGRTKAPLFILLAEWFEDFHEWHLGTGKEGDPVRVHLWDSTDGYRFATEGEARDLFREIARILTLYYDTSAFRQIVLWHHAAGDFIVRTSKTPLEVRLTTARGYRPLPGLTAEAGIHPLVALCYFLLNLLLRLRLDRQEGVGTPLWAGAWAVSSALEGFFKALEEMKTRGRVLPADLPEIHDLLRSFSAGELLRLHDALPALSAEGDPEESPLIQAHLEEHVEAVHQAIQGLFG